MSKSIVTTAPQVSLKQAVDLIVHNPRKRFLLMGSPGIGKTSQLETIRRRMSVMHGIEYNSAYIDVPNLDLGDIAMPVIDHENRVTRYYPNARFRLHEATPTVIMLDEFSKGADPVKNMLHPMLEINNPRLGDISIDPRSVIVLTGNLISDSLGDTMRGHTMNRITYLDVREPTTDEWIMWALEQSHIAPEIIAWVREYPHCLASYRDEAQRDNPYIFNPKRQQKACVTPRSLESASSEINARKHYDNATLMASLAGTIGEAAARDMAAFIEVADSLVPFDEVVANPTGAPLPQSFAATAIFVYGAVIKTTAKNLSNLIVYVDRLSLEWQTVFFVSLSKSPSKLPIVCSNSNFSVWINKNKDVL